MAKNAGLVIMLITGRLFEAVAALGPFNEICEAIVAENGAVINFPRRDLVTLPFGRVDPNFLQQLELLRLPLQRGLAIAATTVPHDEAVLRTLRESHTSVTIEYNRNEVMLLPPGATKGTGLLYALEELGYSPHNVVACGDAENDRSLLDAAELAVAVANAQPALKEVADVVLEQERGLGVEALLTMVLEGHHPPRRPRPNRRLLIGHRQSGTPVQLDPFTLVDTNLGIMGSSGSGKSWLAGLLAEELLKQKYQICLIDPEGDYRSLAASPRTLLLGGSESPLPPVNEVLNIAEWNNVSLVLDLSMYELPERLTYMEKFLRTLRGLRARRGRPHYFFVDEIQHFCPPEGGELTDLLLEAMQWGGFGLISFRPSLVSPALLARLDHLLITRLMMKAELDALQPWLAQHTTGEEVLTQLPTLPKGQAYLCPSPTKTGLTTSAEMIKFRVGRRTVPHVRHLHKYMRTPLPDYKRFYFNHPQGHNVGVAASLWEFREQLGRVPVESLAHHQKEGDFARWLAGVLHDDELVRRFHKITSRQLTGELLRQALLEAVIDRYEELEARL